MIPLRKKMAEGQIDYTKIREHEKEINAPLCMQDFLDALKNV